MMMATSGLAVGGSTITTTTITTTIPTTHTSFTTTSSSSAALSHRDRLRQLVDRMLKRLRGGARVDRRDFYKQCLVLAKAIDFVIASNQTPHSPKDLLQLFKQVCTQKDDTDVRPAVMVLMLSFKGAMLSGWFNAAADSGEVFATVKLLFDQLGDDKKENEHKECQISPCIELVSTTAASVGGLLQCILSRYFPWMKIKKIFLSVEAKPGYEVLTSDFQIYQQPTSEELVHMFVIRKDNIDTSRCLTTPLDVNFLINGYGVERRHNLSMDQGPQMPSDCTPMLKMGANLSQIVGDFQASYVIVIALTSTVTLTSSVVRLENHPLPSCSPFADDELTEGPSRISLRCPISRKRIVTPVKGLSCKHLQSFDFDNYLAINERRPSWRCPYCNMYVNFLDLRLDSSLGKILVEVENHPDVSEILISDDGKWVPLLSNDNMEQNIRNVGIEKLKVSVSFIYPDSCTISTKAASSSDIGAAIVDLTQDDQDYEHRPEVLKDLESSRFHHAAYNPSAPPSQTVIEQVDRKTDLSTAVEHGVQDSSRADLPISCNPILLCENIVSAGSGSPMQNPFGLQGSDLTFTIPASAVCQALESVPMVELATRNVGDGPYLLNFPEGNEEYRSLYPADTSYFLDASPLLLSEQSVRMLPREQMRMTNEVAVQEGLDRQPINQLTRSPITIQALPAQAPISTVNARVRAASSSRPLNSGMPTQTMSQVTNSHPVLFSNQSTAVRHHGREEIHSRPVWHQQSHQDLPRRSIVLTAAPFEASAQIRSHTQGHHFQRLESPTLLQHGPVAAPMQYLTPPSLQRIQGEISHPAVMRAQAEIPQVQHIMHAQQLPTFGQQQQLQQVQPVHYDPAQWQQQRLMNPNNANSGTNLPTPGQTSRAGNFLQGDRVIGVAGNSPATTSPFPVVRMFAGIPRPQLQDERSTLFSPDNNLRFSSVLSNMTNCVIDGRTHLPSQCTSNLIGGQAMASSSDPNWRPMMRMRGSLNSGASTAVNRVPTSGLSAVLNDPLRNLSRVNSVHQSTFQNVPLYSTICTPSSVMANSLEYSATDVTNSNDQGFLQAGLISPPLRYQNSVRPGATNLYLSIAESLPQMFQSAAIGSGSGLPQTFSSSGSGSGSVPQLLASTTGNNNTSSELAALSEFLFNGFESCSALPNLPL